MSNSTERPVDLGVQKCVPFDLQAVGEELRAEPSYQRAGKVARTLFRSEDLTLVTVALHQGGELKEHSAPGAATVLVLQGKIRFNAPDQSLLVEPGQSVLFTRGLPHTVQALEDSLMLVTIGKSNRD